jgi:predicted ATP-dependent serine protease
MADEFTCNSCGKLTDTGYFYCEKCHRIHKEQKQNDKDKSENGNATKEVYKSAREKSSEETIHTDLKVKSE